jgi:hypothetical protein
LTDCDDPDCAEAVVCMGEMNCIDEIDGDMDGEVDCDDPDCIDAPNCIPEAVCDDEADNDLDGAIDCDDSDCADADECFVCEADVDEPNNDRATASRVTGYKELSIHNREDSDWFRWPIPAEHALEVDVFFTHDDDDGDIEIRIWDANGAARGQSSFSSTDNEDVTVLNGSGSHEYVYGEIFRRNGNMCQPYALQVDVPDRLERDGGDDTRETASTPEERERLINQGTGLIEGLTAVHGDLDFMAIPVCNGGRLTVEIFFTHANGDIDLRLRGPEGLRLPDASQSFNDAESLTFTNDTGDEVVVLANPYMHTAGGINVYSFRADVLDAGCDPRGRRPR